jgi:hypothetical protein
MIGEAEWLGSRLQSFGHLGLLQVPLDNPKTHEYVHVAPPIHP